VEPVQAGYNTDQSVLTDLAMDAADWHYSGDEAVDADAVCQPPVSHIQQEK